jgi:hypothetical protein
MAPVYQNSVTTIALPHIADSTGHEYDPSKLVYQWKKNDTVLADQSGYGKQSVTIQGDVVPRDYDIYVTVWPRDMSSIAQAVEHISYTSPSAQFYVDDPLYGPLFNHSIGPNILLGSKNETGVRVVPYGFNRPISSIGGLVLTWLINNTEHSELATNESIILRAPSDSAGSSNVSLDITNAKDILQKASAVFSASFSTPTNSSNSITF